MRYFYAGVRYIGILDSTLFPKRLLITRAPRLEILKEHTILMALDAIFKPFVRKMHVNFALGLHHLSRYGINFH